MRVCRVLILGECSESWREFPEYVNMALTFRHSCVLLVYMIEWNLIASTFLNTLL